MHVLQLGGDISCSKHVGQIYNKFAYDQHGLRLEDVNHIDRQNWVSAQHIWHRKLGRA
jgi:hypothetical protein